MANDERKPTTSSLIPLEIDPASILSLSKGVIFDTIVHNIEYTLSNQRKDPLPWKLIGMSLICDASRNKKYMQKLQKMQCVPSVICTQIYHSKLIKKESGVLTTPGKKIILATTPRKRLTGIIVCRSIDELLHLETSNVENVHFIQYKLLSYERIVTRELINGPKLSSISDKVMKTVFDFELSQNNGFPRQLLPVAIISFGRQDGCDLCLSIRNFLKLEEHKIFDKSYLVTSIDVELDRLREEQERKEDAEIENEIALEKIQRRQPLADLSKKSTDTGNASPVPSLPQPSSLRVPPLKIKIPHQEKPLKSTVNNSLVDTKFRCLLKLDRIDLSLYDISNLTSLSSLKLTKSNEFSTNNKTKSLIITKPHEHHKPLKRLYNSETKKQSISSSERSKTKRSDDSISSSSSTNDITLSLPKNKTKERSISNSSMSPIYRPKPTIEKQTVEKTVTKKKFKRPILPSDYHCSLSLTRIDLSMYSIDSPPVITSVNRIPMDVESTVTSSPSNSTSSEPTNVSIEPEKNHPDTTQSISMMEQETINEIEEENIFQTQSFIEINTPKTLSNIVDEFLTPDLNEPELNINNNEVVSQTNDEPILTPMDEILRSIPMNETVSELIDETIIQTMNDILSMINNKISSEIVIEIEPISSNEESEKSKSSPVQCIAFSPDLPPLDDDPIFISMENPQVQTTTNSDMNQQDYIIIVPCSDDDDDFDDYPFNNDNKNNIIQTDTKSKITESVSSPAKNTTLINSSLTRVLENTNRLQSHRLSTSSSSSCSSISTSILYNQSPSSPLNLIEILIPQKILMKKQRKSIQPINFIRYDLCIPTIAQEPLVDPRLIYRLQSITTDLRWSNYCTQCSMSFSLSSILTSSTQTILYDRTYPSDFIDPRCHSLKNAILNFIYQRIQLLIPHIFIINSNQFQKFLFEQTIFKTNCSLHLEYVLHQLKQSDEKTFFHMIKINDEFQLSPFLLQLIFN